MNLQKESLSEVIQECLHLLNKYSYLCDKVYKLSNKKEESYFINCIEAYHCYKYCRSLMLERAVKTDDFKILNKNINGSTTSYNNKNLSLISVYNKLKKLLLFDTRIELITLEYYCYGYCKFNKSNGINGYLRSLFSHSGISMKYMKNILNQKGTITLIIEITGTLEDLTLKNLVSNRNYIRIPSKIINTSETIEQLQCTLENSLEFLVSDSILFKERNNFDYIFLITTEEKDTIRDEKSGSTINLEGKVSKMLSLFEIIAKNLVRKKESGVYAHLYFSIIDPNRWNKILSTDTLSKDFMWSNVSKNTESTIITSNKINGNENIIIVGIHNRNNCCYINCIIQSLIGTVEFFHYILTLDFNFQLHNPSKSLTITRSLNKLFKEIYDCNIKQNGPININSFKNICGNKCRQFLGNNQEDCVEFCNFLFDVLNEEIKTVVPTTKNILNSQTSMVDTNWFKYLSENDSIISRLFVGQLSSRLKCEICQTSSINYEIFYILSLPIPNVISCNIMECFRQFFREHRLDPVNQWNCINCDRRTPSTQKMTLVRKPKILIIQLKRFNNNLIKNNCFVQYPIYLDHQYTGLPTSSKPNDFKYQLYSVVCHRGSVGNGHYTTYIYKSNNNNIIITGGWFFFDDTTFRSIQTLTEFITPDAYVLFYRQNK